MAAASAGTPAGTAWIKLAGAFDVTPSALITALVTDRRSVRLADGERLA
jgi:methylthioribose-1-phosphate isomerase